MGELARVGRRLGVLPRPRVSARSRIRPGQPTGLAVDTHHLHFFDPASGLYIGHPQAAVALVEE
jgi:hypothetical protein